MKGNYKYPIFEVWVINYLPTNVDLEPGWEDENRNGRTLEENI